MKSIFRAKISVTIFAILILFLVGKWFYTEKTESFSEPGEALLAIDENLLLIPGYELQGESLYFFIKDENKLGAAYIQEAIFGWKIGRGEIPYTTLGDMEEYEQLSHYQVHDDFLVYGMIKNANNHTIKVNGEEAKILNFEEILTPNISKENDFEDMYLWYFESEGEVLMNGEIEIFSNDNGELIDSIEFIVD